ncbi:MAG: ABC transporter permease [Candidatus Hydrogenedentes bacterium]|nr:ABC transporter permease [Candidatus Hydrogenedentota bacterium]
MTSRLRGVLRQNWVRPFGTLLFVIILATVFSPYRQVDPASASGWDYAVSKVFAFSHNGIPIFLGGANLANILQQIAVIAVIATGMTLVIISGGIDLSVGSLLALSGTIFAHTLSAKQWPLPFAIAAALLAASLFGLASGVLISGLRMQPFIVTLAAMIGSRGFSRWLVDNANIDIGFGEGSVTRVVEFVAQKMFLIPAFLIVAAIGHILLRMTRFGRYLYAVGGSETAARLTGINVNWVKIRVYTLCGFLAGVAGIMHCCENYQGNPNAGVAYELDAIAAAVIGGTSLAGGKGSIFGTMVGALALGILSNLLGLNNVDENIQFMLKAVIIVIAVWLQLVGTKRDT